jgi:hypothetical protein
VVGAIPLLRHVKPRSSSEIKVIEGTSDLAKSLGADMGVCFDKLSMKISVVLLLE